MLDTVSTDVLVRAYPCFKDSLASVGQNLPKNEPANAYDSDNLLRELDCALVNWTLEKLAESGLNYDSVRGVCQEGADVYPNSAIRRRSHIQIAVRDPLCIIGYFLPSFEGK